MTNKNIEKLAVETRKAYYRKWRAANKDKVKQHNESYWRRQAEKLAAEQAANSEVDNERKV